MATTLTKGANCPVPGDRIAVEIVSGAAIDVSALLVTVSGKVRSDDDFVFYNNPNGPGVTYRAAGAEPEAVVMDLGSVPPEIDKIVVTASLDGAGPASFGAAGSVSATVRQPGGAPEVTFAADGMGAETAILVVEVYRRQGAWKVRGVGQGYSNGLGGIATDFGITVEDEPSAPPAPPPPPPPPPRVDATRPPPPQAAPTPPPPAPTGTINLDKGRVSLKKSQTVSLVKTGAPPLTKVRMGLGWDEAGSGKDIDLDASCILFDNKRKKVDTVWFMSKKGDKGAVRHSGDNLTGAGAGDDETIVVDLAALSGKVVALVFTVNSYSGQTFGEIRNAFCRLVDDTSNEELVRFEVSEMKRTTGVIMCKLTRDASGTGPWSMTALAEFHDGKTVRQMVDPAARLL